MSAGATCSAGVRILLGTIFLTAAAAKINGVEVLPQGVVRGVDAFAVSLAHQGLLPAQILRAVAWTVVGVEFVAGLWLLSHRFPRTALLSAIAILGAFSIYLGVAMARPQATACSCFGGAGATEAHTALARNVVLVILALGAIRLARPTPATDSPRRTG